MPALRYDASPSHAQYGASSHVERPPVGPCSATVMFPTSAVSVPISSSAQPVCVGGAGQRRVSAAERRCTDLLGDEEQRGPRHVQRQLAPV
jgi:hypothetical protein